MAVHTCYWNRLHSFPRHRLKPARYRSSFSVASLEQTVENQDTELQNLTNTLDTLKSSTKVCQVALWSSCSFDYIYLLISTVDLRGD